MSKVSYRSYEVEAMGERYRRNRKHLIPLNTPMPTNGLPDAVTCITLDATKDPLGTRQKSRPPDKLIEHM